MTGIINTNRLARSRSGFSSGSVFFIINRSKLKIPIKGLFLHKICRLWAKFLGKIFRPGQYQGWFCTKFVCYGQNFWAKFLGKISGQNFWAKFLGKISGQNFQAGPVPGWFCTKFVGYGQNFWAGPAPTN